jgi:DNA-binding protein YbaB
MGKYVDYLPSDVTLGSFSKKVCEILRKRVALGWAILSTRCAQADLDPEMLKPEDLEHLTPLLADGVARFTSPQNGEMLRNDLNELAEMHGKETERQRPVAVFEPQQKYPHYLPDGVSLSHFSMRVFEIICKYTVLAWSVLKTQCARLSIDPTEILPQDIEAMTPFLVKSISRFTSPQKGERLKSELLVLASKDRIDDLH